MSIDIFEEDEYFNKYESEILTEFLINIFFNTKEDEIKKIGLLKSALKKRGINTNTFDEKLYINNFIKLLPIGWSKVANNMFEELLKNNWNKNLPIRTIYKDEDFSVSYEEGIRLSLQNSYNENLKLETIIKIFENIINQTCTKCGNDNAQLNYDVYKILCESCSKEI